MKKEGSPFRTLGKVALREEKDPPGGNGISLREEIHIPWGGERGKSIPRKENGEYKREDKFIPKGE